MDVAGIASISPLGCGHAGCGHAGRPSLKLGLLMAPPAKTRTPLARLCPVLPQVFVLFYILFYFVMFFCFCFCFPVLPQMLGESISGNRVSEHVRARAPG